MKTIKYFIIFMSFVYVSQVKSQVSKDLNGIKINDSINNVLPKLYEIADSVQITKVDDLVFPLSSHSETHAVLKNIKTTKGMIDQMVLTFADGKLKFLQAKGNVVNILVKPADSAFNYYGLDIYLKKKLIINTKDDKAWYLSNEALHLNLFTWDNPYLSKTHISPPKNYNIPNFIRMGDSLESLKPIFEKENTFVGAQELDGSDPNAQLQLNCFGFQYLGFPRKMEARFGDGKLNVVWILTGKEEESRIRLALIEQYGQPIFTNDDWEIFNNWQVGLRKDKPEILLVTPEIGVQYKNRLLKQ